MCIVYSRRAVERGLTMEKKAVIEDGTTPPEDANEKMAGHKCNDINRLADHTTKRLAEEVEKKIKSK